MTTEEFKRLQQQCKPTADSYNPQTEPAAYYPLTFARAMLPKINPFNLKYLKVYDGAELFKGAAADDNKILKIKAEETPYSVSLFTYPKGVLAEKLKSKLQVGQSEISVLAEVSQDDKVEVYFRVGKTLEKLLLDYYKDSKLPNTGKTISTRTFNTDIPAFKSKFSKQISHFNIVKYVLNTMGAEIVPENEKPRFVKGVWTNIAGEPISSALVFDTVYFQIETENIKEGENIFVSLYDDDTIIGLEKADKDEHIKLVKSDNSPYLFAKTDKNGTIRIPILLENLDPYLKNETDRALELYFRCSYNKLHVELPLKEKEYLKVIGLPQLPVCIDRYKIPGLNQLGTGLAEDLAYGYGVKRNYQFLKEIAAYKEQYKLSGFDKVKHSLFSNADTQPNPLKSNKEDGDDNTSNTNQTTEARPVEIDNTFVNIPVKYLLPEVIKNQADRNRKAFYSKAECYKSSFKVKIPYLNKVILEISTGLDVRIFDLFSDEFLFWDFEETATLYFAKGDMQANIKEMIAKFKRNEGGIYESEILTKTIIENKSTQEYCQSVQDYIAEKLKNGRGNLQLLEDTEPDFISRKREEKGKLFTRPVFAWNKDGNVLRGETIALNDIWATEVFITHYHRKDDNYTIKYQVTLWDHFGLDIPDMEKVFNIIPSAGETFVCWFILQHLRGYKPFLTKITFEKEFTGSLNKGKKEREDERKKQKGLKDNDKVRIWLDNKM